MTMAENGQTKDTRLQPVETMMVCLDLTDMDASLIAYAGFLAGILETPKVTFLHVIQSYDLPDRTQKGFPDVETELQQIVRNSLYQSVKQGFTEQCQWHVETRVGQDDAAVEIINYTDENPADLILIGQKPGENRRARYGKKVSAETTGDILFVPQNAALRVDPLLCASDFTDAGARAFERALGISKTAGVRLLPFFITDPTRAYFPTTTTRSTRKYEEKACETYAAFLKRYNIQPDSLPCLVELGDPMKSEAETIYAAAEKRDTGLILVGARGSTQTPTSHLGNLCESLRLLDKQIPVMIVKPDVN
ncbi:MAG: universal stress protein [Thermodesulfobacteriota bacterium]|nr:universal stress protein [Thermodesulfobacteriota bacterium]